MNAQIERLQSGDGNRWRRIRMRALEDAPYAFGTKVGDAVRWPAARWEEQVAELATFVAVVEGSDVGVVRGAAHARNDVRELISMWIAPSMRRHGVGAQLIEHVAAWATDAGARVLVLDVVESNRAAIALYERAGFVRCIGDGLGEHAAGEFRFMRSLGPAHRA